MEPSRGPDHIRAAA